MRIGKCKLCGGELYGSAVRWGCIIETTCQKCKNVIDKEQKNIVTLKDGKKALVV